LEGEFIFCVIFLKKGFVDWIKDGDLDMSCNWFFWKNCGFSFWCRRVGNVLGRLCFVGLCFVGLEILLGRYQSLSDKNVVVVEGVGGQQQHLVFLGKFW